MSSVCGDRSRVDRELCSRARRELPRPCPRSLGAGVAPLHEGVHGRGGENGDHRRGHGPRDDRSPLTACGRDSFGFQLPIGLVSRSPDEDGLGENVVKDLVPGRPVRGGYWSKNPLRRERVQDRFHLLLADSRVLREIGDAVRDLRAGRRDEVIEHLRRRLLAFRRQRV